ncbi:MAG: hypothetical protein ACLR5H_00155 [Oscillospiraceae bacterium]
MNGSGYTIVQAGAEVPAEEFVRRYVDLADPAAGCRPARTMGSSGPARPMTFRRRTTGRGLTRCCWRGCSSTSPRPCWSGGLTRRSWRNIPGG